MSAARKVTAPAQGEVARPTSTELESHCRACETHLCDAKKVLQTAAAALAVPHDDVDQRSHEQAVEHNARLRVEKARKTLEDHRSNLEATKRREDEAEALELAGRVCRSAQILEIKAINKSFETLVLGGLRRFFDDLAERRAGFDDAAHQLDKIWARLGHKHVLPGVDLEQGTGTESIPPSASIGTLRNYSGLLLQQLKERMSSPDPLERAAAMLLVGAFERDRERHLALGEFERAAADRCIERREKGENK